MRLNDERTKFRKLCRKTLKLKIIVIFFTKQYFCLNSNPTKCKIVKDIDLMKNYCFLKKLFNVLILQRNMCLAIHPHPLPPLKNSHISLPLKTSKISKSVLKKQLYGGVLRKRRSENMQQIYRRPPVPKCDFNKVSLKLY